MSVIEMVQKLNEEYPRLLRKITSGSVGRILSERGFKSVRKGAQKSSGYMISKESKIKHLDEHYPLLGCKNFYNPTGENKA
jgi:hypothetical protein